MNRIEICTYIVLKIIANLLNKRIKRAKKRYDEYEIVLILEKNIRAFLGLHKLTHGLTFGIIYFCKYYRQ